MKASNTPKFLSADDRVRRAKASALELYQIADRQRELLHLLHEDVERLKACDLEKKTLTDLIVIIGRVHRLHELVNTMECGSFSIHVNRAMDAVYQEISRT